MAGDSDTITSGRCLCGGVHYRVDGALRPVWQCHCIRCRRATGNFMAASGAPAARIRVTDDADRLTWFHPDDDPDVAYAFCSTCGSSLFWRVVNQGGDAEHWSICAGTLDDPIGLRTEAIWFSDHAAAHTTLDPGPRHIPSSDL